MPEYELRPNVGKTVKISASAWERVRARVHALEAVERAARLVVADALPSEGYGVVNVSNNVMANLVGAISKYDGWDDTQEQFEQAVESMQQILKELEERDANP